MSLSKPDITVRNYGDLTLRPFPADPLPTLDTALELLDELPAYAHGGTALGIYRDKRFIPHDSDVDLSLNLDWRKDHYSLTVELVRRFAQANMTLLRSLIAGDKPCQLVFTDLANHGVWLDLEIYYTGIKRGHHVHYKPNGAVVLPSRLVSDQTLHSFRGLDVPIPKPTEDYFACRYGPDWQTPMQHKGRWEDYTPVFTPWKTDH